MARTPRNNHTIEPDAARAAWDQLTERVTALEPERVMAPPPDPRTVSQAVHGALQFTSDEAVRARFLKLPPEELSPTALDELQTLFNAFEHTRNEIKTAQDAQVEFDLPGDLAQRANDLRARMTKVVVHYLEDDPEFSAEVKSLGRKGKTHAALAADLTRLAAFYEARRDVVERDPKYYKATDAAEAREAAEEIQKLLAAARGDAEKVWTDRMARVWTFLHGAYEEVQAAGLYLYRKDSGEERFPTLQTTRRTRTPKARKDESDGA